uniref:Myb-like domain-containing protein n=1 Tax=Haemonchus contortus TaxID=6289 RepID=A0A7I4Y1R1_HAECO
MAPQHRPLLADIAIDLPKKIKDNYGTEDPVVEVAPVRKRTPQREGARSWTSKSRKADPADLEQRCEGEWEAWFWNDEVQRVVRQKKSACKRWQRTRALEDLVAYGTSKKLAKAAVAKAKYTEMDALCEKLDSR